MSRTIKKQNISRLVACLLSLIMLMSLLPAANAAETSGQCGDNLSWSFADNRLTITGSGKMTDYNQRDRAPWYEFREQIFYLSLPEGMTSVGCSAFYDCGSLTSVTLPSTVKEIGSTAFYQCKSITILNLPSGVKTIGANAFERCESVRDLRLPTTLQTIGNKAFYRCTSLQYVTVPVLATDLGNNIFAYCTGLIGAQIDAPIAEVPAWTFYGCTSLTSVVLPEATKQVDSNAFGQCDQMYTVYYPGTEADAEEIRVSIGEQNEHFENVGSVTAEEPPKQTGTTTGVSATEEGNIIVDKTTVTVTENATIGTTVQETKDESGVTASVTINATIIADEGWDDVAEAVDEAIAALKEKTEAGAKTETILINGYVAGSEEVPQEILEKISGVDASLDIQTESGAKFEVDGSVIRDQEIPSSLVLSYSSAKLAQGTYPDLKGTMGYAVRFFNSSAVKTEFKFRLPLECGRQTASLYQIEDKKPVLLQSVVVDKDGYAHFFIAEISKDMEYVVSINEPGIDKNTIIIPEELYGEYGVDQLSQPIEYVITGRTSSWGMDAGTVTLILVAVLVVCVAGVGVFMYTMNKRKLKMGYVPELDDDSED